jgi:hypothetical protein
MLELRRESRKAVGTKVRAPERDVEIKARVPDVGTKVRAPEGAVELEPGVERSGTPGL